MSQGPLCPNLSQKVQAEVSQMANRNLSHVILLGGLSVNLNPLKSAILKSGTLKQVNSNDSQTFTCIANRQLAVSFLLIKLQVQFPTLFQQIRNHNLKDILHQRILKAITSV